MKWSKKIQKDLQKKISQKEIRIESLEKEKALQNQLIKDHESESKKIRNLLAAKICSSKYEDLEDLLKLDTKTLLFKYEQVMTLKESEKSKKDF